MPNAETSKAGHTRRSRRLAICLLLLLGVLFLLWKHSGDKPDNIADERITSSLPILAPIEEKQQDHSEDLHQDALQSEVKKTRRPPENPIEIFGRVMLVGKPPEERLIYVKQHADGSQTQVMSRDFEVSVETGLANVFVYVQRGLEGKKFPSTTETLFLRETNHFLEPFVIGARVEQPIEVQNTAYRHHHRLVSSDGKEFPWRKNTEGRMDDPLELIFSEQDILSHITCHFHEWEWIYFGVVDHPYFAVTDKEGYFKLPKGIPPGRYTIAARHPKSREVVERINAVPGGKYQLLFKVRAPASPSKSIQPIIEKEGESPEDNDRVNTTNPRITGIVQRGTKAHTPIAGTIGNGSIVRGQITLTGVPPPEKRIDAAKNDSLCGKLIDEAPMTRFYVVGERGELADTVVYLEPLEENPKFSSRVEPVVIESIKCQLTPTILALQTGQRLIVRNSDPLLHNAHFVPHPGSGNKEINKSLMRQNEFEVSFTKPEPFLRMKCDVHPWELAYISVFEHPFFTVSDINGRFTITNVPPGRFRLHATHRKAGTESENLAVIAKSEYEMNIMLEAK